MCDVLLQLLVATLSGLIISVCGTLELYKIECVLCTYSLFFDVQIYFMYVNVVCIPYFWHVHITVPVLVGFSADECGVDECFLLLF
jgi:hypothetical protein